MKTIIFNNEHRKKHFKFFNEMNHPHFNITANIEIGSLHKYCKKHELSITHAIVFLISKTANEIPEFKWRIRDNNVVEHKTVQPSFTVDTDASDVFSFCTVNYNANPSLFLKDARNTSEAMKTNPDMEDEIGRDDYLFLSSIPWVSFTGVQHAMHYHPCDSVPRIIWGKFFDSNEKTMMPLSVQVHHAIVDGKHVGLFYQNLEKMTKNPEAIFKIKK